MESNKIHKSFRLNESAFTDASELMAYVSSISDESADFLKEWFDESHYVTVQTSGSTGVPKKIKLNKTQLVNSARMTGDYFQLHENTTALLCLSSAFIAGKMMWVRALVLGWHIDVVGTDSNPLEKNSKQYDFTAMVPLQVANSIAQLFRIKKIIIGGGVVSDELQEKLQGVSTQAFATYGMTETVTHIAVKQLNGTGGEEYFYKVLPSIEIARDERGCLVIAAPLLSDEKVITNDLVELIAPNQFQWLGRYDAIINSGGVKLIPEQIEKKIEKVLSEKFFIGSKSDVFLGEKVILVVEGNHHSITEKKDILAFLKGVELKPFEIPKEICFVKEFVLTETGKIKRALVLEKLV